MPTEQKLGLLKKYSISFFQKLFFIGMRPDVAKLITDANTYNGKLLEKYGDGFIPFKTNKTKKRRIKQDMPKNLAMVRNSFLRYQGNARKPTGTFNTVFLSAVSYTHLTLPTTPYV